MKLNRIDLNKVAVFCQIVDSGNYRRASEVLNVTPSALSQSVSVLEHALGFPLFHRVGKKLVPTAQGARLHRDFRHHHRGLLQSVQELMQEKTEVEGLLRIGAYLEFAKTQLTPLITEFLQTHPGARIKLVFEPPTRLHRMLEEDRLDLCFSIFPSRESPGISSERIYQQELVLVTPPRWFDGTPSFDELMKSPMIEYYFNHQPIRRWLALHYRKKPKELPIRAYVSTAEMVLELVREGLGVGIVPRYLIEREDLHRQLEICRPSERKFTDHIWMLERKRHSRSRLHQAFSEHVLERLNEAD